MTVAISAASPSSSANKDGNIEGGAIPKPTDEVMGRKRKVCMCDDCVRKFGEELREQAQRSHSQVQKPRKH